MDAVLTNTFSFKRIRIDFLLHTPSRVKLDEDIPSEMKKNVDFTVREKFFLFYVNIE